MHFSELQPILQSHRNISSNLGSTGGKSVVFGSSLNSDYLHPRSIETNSFFNSPYPLGNILSDCGIVLQLRWVVSYMLLLRLKTSSPFRSIIHNASCRGHHWPIHCTHKEVLPLRLLQCPLQNIICAISWNFVFFDTIFSVVNFPSQFNIDVMSQPGWHG